MARIFDRPDGSSKPWDYVFNLGGATAFSQNIEVYRLRSLNLSVTLANEAARRGVKAYVEASTGMVYAASRTPRKETDRLKPWLKLAKCKLEAEEALSKIPKLPLVILRMAHVYGEYDSAFIAKALCLARLYQEQDRELKWLWTEDLRINTVHVEDVARAIWQAAEWRAENDIIPESRSPTTRRGSVMAMGNSEPSSSLSSIPIFNIVDHGLTSQGTLASILSEVFQIKTGFQGSIISQFAKMHLDSVVDDLNEDSLQPWSDMLIAKGITRPGPLSPFLEKELLKDSDLSLDGSLFERVTGFKYEREPDGLSKRAVEEMVASYERMGWWP
jgi:nucleoside-diphosphate-sugar epimerase